MAVRIFKKHESMLPSTEQFIADAIITSHVKLVYDRNHYFGLGQKPKPKMADTTFGQILQLAKTIFQRKKSSC